MGGPEGGADTAQVEEEPHPWFSNRELKGLRWEKLGKCQVNQGRPPSRSICSPQSGNGRDSTALTEGVKEANLHPSPLWPFPPSTCPLPTQGRGLWAVRDGATRRSCPSAAGTSFCPVGGRCGGTEARRAGPPAGYRRGEPRWSELTRGTCQPHERPQTEAGL